MERKTNRPPRRERIDRNKLEREAMMRVDLDVWDIIHKTMRASKRETAEELFAQEYKNERERIAQNSRKYANVSVAEAFADIYGVKISDEVKEKSDVIPMDLMLGQIINLKIHSITKDGVIFDSGHYKANFSTRNNLSRYAKFKEFLPTNEIPVRVIEIHPDTVMVDIFGPMIESFIIPRVRNPWTQNKLKGYQPVKVKNLQLVRGGFLGQAVIPNVSDWVGEEYTVDAFIPGSQIVQNTTADFEKFNGSDVDTFIIAYNPKPGTNNMSLICSAKSLIKHRGNLRMMEIHKWWCDNEQNWETFSEQEFDGIVTGIINSSQKCGVFVEIPELEITGMVGVPADKLSEYHPGDSINVSIGGFDEKMVYNELAGQMQHTTPFEVVDGAIKEVNIKPILKEV